MRHELEHLERYVQVWETEWFCYSVIDQSRRARSLPGYDFLKNAPRLFRALRQVLLEAHTSNVEGDIGDLLEFAAGRLSGNDAWDDFFRASFLQVVTSILAWCKFSRRVYGISEDLMTLLQLTNLRGVSYSQVKFPFTSFALSLATPIEIGEREYDFLLVSVSSHHKWEEWEDGPIVPDMDDRGSLISTVLFPATIRSTRVVSPLERQSIGMQLRQHKWETAERRVLHIDAQMSASKPEPLVIVWNVVDSSVEVPILEVIRQSADANDTSSEIVCRLLIGFCLYKQSVETRSPSPFSGWKPPLRTGRPDPRAVTNGAEVCTVSSIYILTLDERQVIGPSKRAFEMCCHFREGHWRRPPGLGSDPNADKTVWVRPTLVRRDRLPEGGLPGGAQQNVDLRP